MNASMNPPSGVTPGGDGIEMVITVDPDHGDVVCLMFNKPVTRIYFPPKQANAIGMKFAEKAYLAEFKDTPTTKYKNVMTDKKFAVLRVRVKKMLDGMEGQPSAIVANAILDTIAGELL